MLYFFDVYNLGLKLLLLLIGTPSPLELYSQLIYFCLFFTYITSFIYLAFFATTWNYNFLVIFKSILLICLVSTILTYTIFTSDVTFDVNLYIYLYFYVLYLVFTIKYLRIFEFIFDLKVMPFGLICLLLPLILFYVITVNDVCYFFIFVELTNVIVLYFLLFSMKLMRYEVEGIASYITSAILFSIFFSYAMYISMSIGLTEINYFEYLTTFTQRWVEVLTVWPLLVSTLLLVCVGVKFGLQPSATWLVAFYKSFSEKQVFFYFGYFYTLFLIILIKLLSFINLIVFITQSQCVCAVFILLSLLYCIKTLRVVKQVNLLTLSTQVTTYTILLMLI